MANEGKIVTGVGSRNVSNEGALRVAEIAKLLNEAGYTLRSGGAEGCDMIFEENMSKKEIYLPWKGFNGNDSKLYGITDGAMEIASTVHPKFENLSEGAQKLHARNVYQVLGKKMDRPSDLLVCWTGDGSKSEKTSTSRTGGTRTAIVLADRNNVPVYNLFNEHDYVNVKNLLKKEIAQMRGETYVEETLSVGKSEPAKPKTKGEKLYAKDENVKTLMFPPKSFRRNIRDGKWGYEIQRETGFGKADMVIVPEKLDNVKVYALKGEGDYKGWLVVKAPKDTKLRRLEMEYDERNVRVTDMGAVALDDKFVDTMRKELSDKFRGKSADKEERKAAEAGKDAQAKEEAKTAEPAQDNAAKDAKGQDVKQAPVQEKDENQKTIWVESADVIPLSGNKGAFIKGFEFGKETDLVIYAPTKAEGIETKVLKNWTKIDTQKGTKFHLYRPDRETGKGYVDTGWNIDESLVRKTVFRQKEAREAKRNAQAKAKEAGNALEK